jgi:hypothetical protein
MDKTRSDEVSRYPWENAPEWAQFAATDSSGVRTWFGDKPRIVRYADDEAVWLGKQWRLIDGKGSSHDFAASLEPRPTPRPDTTGQAGALIAKWRTNAKAKGIGAAASIAFDLCANELEAALRLKDS